MPKRTLLDEDSADPLIWPHLARAQQADPKHESIEEKSSRKGTFPSVVLSKLFFEALVHKEARTVFHGIVSHMRYNTSGAWRYAAHYQDMGHVVIVQFHDGRVLPRLTQHGYDLLEVWRLATRLAQRVDVQERLPADLRASLASRDSE